MCVRHFDSLQQTKKLTKGRPVSSGLKGRLQTVFRSCSIGINRFNRNRFGLIPLAFLIRTLSRGTQRMVSVNYLFGGPLIPSDFLKRIVASNFRGMRNSMSVVLRLLKMSFWVPKKGQLSFSER